MCINAIRPEALHRRLYYHMTYNRAMTSKDIGIKDSPIMSVFEDISVALSVQ